MSLIRFLPFVLLAFVTLLIASAEAQQFPRRDPQALLVLDQAFVRMGGLSAARITDVRVQGALAGLDAPDRVSGTFVAKARGADFTVETSRDGHITSFRVLKGRGSFKSDATTTELRPYNTRGLWLDLLPVFSRWTEFRNSGTAIHNGGTVQLNGRFCQVVRVETAETYSPRSRLYANDHGKMEILIDVAAGLVEALRYRVTLGPYESSRILVENRFADYRDFGGILLPTRITRRITGGPAVVFHVQTVDFNNGFTNADFQN